MNEIKDFCKCSKGVFYKRLEELKKIKLVTVEDMDIHIASWTKVADKYSIKTLNYHTINYETENKKQTVEYFIRAAEIAENKEKQEVQVLRKLDKTPEIITAFEDFYTKQGKKADLSLEAMHQVQKITFAIGAAEYDAIHSINLDLNRSGKGIKKAYNFHSNRSATYLKNQLQARGMATITDRTDAVCKFEGKGARNSQVRGKTSSIGSIIGVIIPTNFKKGIKQKCYTTFFKNDSKVWRLPDDIKINENLLKS